MYIRVRALSFAVTEGRQRVGRRGDGDRKEGNRGRRAKSRPGSGAAAVCLVRRRSVPRRRVLEDLARSQPTRPADYTTQHAS